MELAPGTLLQAGKYKIIGKLGQGGFGIAYRAHDQNLKRDVCIKEFFYSDLCERALNSLDVTIITKSAEKISLVNSFKKKFTKEAQRLAKFQHPNIVQVTDTFDENSTAYFVMEYLQGGSLEDLLSKEGVLNEQKAKELILPLIDALDSIHKTDLLHLDIKPANIMLRNNLTPVLIDFGISKYMELAGGATTTAPVGISKGYAPLEQYGGSISDFSKATDVYSLCATLYKMVTGITPSEPLQILSSGLKSPRDIKSQLTTDFNAAIVKGLATKKADRHQSMSQLIAALSVLKKNSPSITKTVFKIEESVLTSAYAYYTRAELKKEKGRHREAIIDYTEAIKKKPADYSNYLGRAWCHDILREYAEAIEDYSKVIQLNPEYSTAYFYRGQCYKNMGLTFYGIASKDFFRALEIENGLKYFQSWIDTVIKTYSNDALATLDKYLINDWPKKDIVYYERGKIYLNSKKRKLGILDLKQAIELGNKEAIEVLSYVNSHFWKYR